MTRVALVSYFFPPAGAVHRPLKFAALLADRGVEVHVVAPADPGWIYADDEIGTPPNVSVHRVRFPGPRARRLGDELYGKRATARLATQVRHLFPRLLVPDEFVTWVPAATRAAIALARRRALDVVLTTSSPASIHLVGAAVKRATGTPWIADVRDSLVANPDRRTERALVRVKQTGERGVAHLVARYADVVVAATEAIANELESLGSGAVTLIRNGCDYEEFTGLAYSRGDRFTLTHTGSFYGTRDPRPVLRAVAESRCDVTLRFVGDFRPRDHAYAVDVGLADRIELHGHVSRRRALELQRGSEALLLLVPHGRGHGRGVLPAKLFEYLAAGRPILAAVPTDGEAAALVREACAGDVVAPDDVDGIRLALEGLVDRFDADRLDPVVLPSPLRASLARTARVDELSAVIDRARSGGTRGS